MQPPPGQHPPPGQYLPSPRQFPPGPPPARLRSVGSRTVFIAIALTLTIGLIGGLLWAALAPDRAEAAEVELQSLSTSGNNPFMAPVGQDQPDIVAPPGSVGAFSGDTPGLFASGGDKPSCDSESLVANLKADPVKMAAWAEALSIRTEDIPSFAQSIEPVLLRSDTAVTQHGYTKPSYTSYPSVLQAGTAVFVNSLGEPTVKCFNGNPLTPPADFTGGSFAGASWGHFKPGSYTYVQPTRTVVKNYSYYDITLKTITVVRTWCDRNPGARVCQNPNPASFCQENPKFPGCRGRDGGANREGGQKRPPPAPDCTADGDSWACPGSVDLSNPPAAGCTFNGQAWFCPGKINTIAQPAPGCKSAGTGWDCPPKLNPKKPPAPGCTANAAGTGWACPSSAVEGDGQKKELRVPQTQGGTGEGNQSGGQGQQQGGGNTPPSPPVGGGPQNPCISQPGLPQCDVAVDPPAAGQLPAEEGGGGSGGGP